MPWLSQFYFESSLHGKTDILHPSTIHVVHSWLPRITVLNKVEYTPYSWRQDGWMAELAWVAVDKYWVTGNRRQTIAFCHYNEASPTKYLCSVGICLYFPTLHYIFLSSTCLHLCCFHQSFLVATQRKLWKWLLTCCRPSMFPSESHINDCHFDPMVEWTRPRQMLEIALLWTIHLFYYSCQLHLPLIPRVVYVPVQRHLLPARAVWSFSVIEFTRPDNVVSRCELSDRVLPLCGQCRVRLASYV